MENNTKKKKKKPHAKTVGKNPAVTILVLEKMDGQDQKITRDFKSKFHNIKDQLIKRI